MDITAKKDKTEVIKALLEDNDVSGLEHAAAGMRGTDIGRILAAVDEDKAIVLFKVLRPETASEALLEVDERRRKTLISSITPAELIEVVEEMETDDAADVISELPVEDAQQVLDGIAEAESQEVKKLLVYDEHTAGGKMQAELVSIAEGSTVEQAIEEVRKNGREMKNLSNVYVVDSTGRLSGEIALNQLILAAPGASVNDIAEKDPIKVRTDLDQEEVAKIFQRYDLLALPVVDAAGKLVGRITVDDVVDVIEEELFEDFYKMAGLNLEERALAPASHSIRMRFPWLLVNLGTAFLAASVVKLFQGTIEKFVVLAVLMPIVAGMGGNAATQAVTVMVRGLALGELSLKNARRMLVKEALVGLANGVLTGLCAAAVAYILGANMMIGLLLLFAMSANLVIAGLSGALIPLVLKWFKVDPAISSSVFVTTCTDVGGFLSFLGLATIFMKTGLL